MYSKREHDGTFLPKLNNAYITHTDVGKYNEFEIFVKKDLTFSRCVRCTMDICRVYPTPYPMPTFFKLK